MTTTAWAYTGSHRWLNQRPRPLTHRRSWSRRVETTTRHRQNKRWLLITSFWKKAYYPGISSHGDSNLLAYNAVDLRRPVRQHEDAWLCDKQAC
jgi:hypothetical protein